MIGYVDPSSGEKIVYKKGSGKRRSSYKVDPLRDIYQSVCDKYDAENGTGFRSDRSAANKRINDIKKILQQSRQNRESDFNDFMSVSDDDISSYVDLKEDARLHAQFAKQKRFMRRGFFNRDRWTWFSTFTWDGSIHDTAEDWMKSILRFFGNTAFRRGVRFLGAFEFGDDNGRLHFHCLISDPENYFSDLKKVHRFSQKDHCWKNMMESVMMRQKFGINDFESLDCGSDKELRSSLLYTCHYAIKNGGRVYTSRGLPLQTIQYLDIVENCYYAGEEGVLKLLLRPDYQWTYDGPSIFQRILNEDLPFRDVS